MADQTSAGYWVRRFLSEYLVHERGASRNTQQSYRDTFCLLFCSSPIGAKRQLTSLPSTISRPTFCRSFSHT
jgi:hypothetical protein